MSAAGLPSAQASGAARWTVDGAKIRTAALWTLVASGASAAIEPSPYEFMFAVAALAFVGAGALRFDRTLAPLIVTLAIFVSGGLLALPPYIEIRESVTFAFISVYIAITAIFYAALVAAAPLERMATIRSGYVAAGVFAAVLGIVGYFDIAGLGPYFTLYDNARASGPFKDPNVFGPFLTPPIVFLTQDLLLKRAKGFWRATLPLGVMSLAVFLSFSRGAWGDYVASLALLVALTFVTTRSTRLRARIVVIAVAGALLVSAILIAALSLPGVYDVFAERASFAKDYDLGEMGRFGNQARSIPLLLERFFGFGPLQFRHIFVEDPHETYINAFASYGWIGGLAFLVFTGVTLYVGWRLVFTRSAGQREAIAVWSCLFVQMAQGLQIDTDHWRHLYLLIGALYGLAATARMERREPARAAEADRRRTVANQRLAIVKA